MFELLRMALSEGEEVHIKYDEESEYRYGRRFYEVTVGGKLTSSWSARGGE